MDKSKTERGKIFKTLKEWLSKISLKRKLAILAIILIIVWFAKPIFSNDKKQAVSYQTAQAEKGTLMVTVTASGQVSQANSATITTKASGVISRLYVENGQTVKTGDKIAEIDLDLEGKQRAAAAWSSYQSAKNNLENAKINYYSLHADLLTKWKDYMDLAQNSKYENSDKSPNTTNRQLPEYMVSNDQWLEAEAKYKQQENAIAQAQTALNNAWLSYQQTSPTIYAPISGSITGLILQIGSVLIAQSNSSGTAAAQKIASIQTNAPPIISVNLTQIDTPKVKIGNKATVTFDAFPDKTFTGKVISIDTIGSISSGVTTYPAYIRLDVEAPEIYSNMTASATIITEIKDNVVMIPSNAIITQNEQSKVRVLRNGKIEEVNVEKGLSSATQTEIISGISEGEIIVTSMTSTPNRNQINQTQSPFSIFGGGRNQGTSRIFR